MVTRSGAELPTRSTLRAWPATADEPAALTWVARDISTERAVYERLHKKVFEDDLTGLPHRSIFLDRLDLSLRRTHQGAPDVTLLFIGIDRFRERTDRLAPAAREELLRGVAARLDGLRRPTDSVARWGNDEFLYLFEDERRASDGAERVQAAFAAPFRAGDAEVFLTASIGAATGRPGSVSTDQLLRQADAASQMARQRGGGALHRFDGVMQDRARRRAEVEDALRGAADRGELVLHFQPEVSLRTNQIVGRRVPRALAAPRLGPRVPRRVRPRGRDVQPHPRGRRVGPARPPPTSARAGATATATAPPPCR